MSAATKSFDRRYFINARWPQWGATAQRYMWDVPQFFSQQHMYVGICVCVWHQYISGALSSCVGCRSSEEDQFKVTVWELRWARLRSVAEPDERWGRGGVNHGRKVLRAADTGGGGGGSWQVLIGNHSPIGSIMHFVTPFHWDVLLQHATDQI